MTEPTPEHIPSKIQIGLPALLLIVSLCVGGTWSLTQMLLAQQGQQSEQAKCLAEAERDILSNTRRIENLEEGQQDLRRIPAQIASMSSDIKYLRQSVERLMTALDEARHDRSED